MVPSRDVNSAQDGPPAHCPTERSEDAATGIRDAWCDGRGRVYSIRRAQWRSSRKRGRRVPDVGDSYIDKLSWHTSVTVEWLDSTTNAASQFGGHATSFERLCRREGPCRLERATTAGSKLYVSTSGSMSLVSSKHALMHRKPVEGARSTSISNQPSRTGCSKSATRFASSVRSDESSRSSSGG